MDTIDTATIPQNRILAWLEDYTGVIAEKRDYLTELDAAIGDADHGANMDRGFQAVATKRAELASLPIGPLLKAVSLTLISKVGGASGPLYGTLFLQASKAAGEKEFLRFDDWIQLWDYGLQGIKARGKAVVGDKTLIDVLEPAVEALRALPRNTGMGEALAHIASVACEGVAATIPLIARKGRASYLGERSAGHPDPGATSMYFLFFSAARAVPDNPYPLPPLP